MGPLVEITLVLSWRGENEARRHPVYTESRRIFDTRHPSNGKEGAFAQMIGDMFFVVIEHSRIEEVNDRPAAIVCFEMFVETGRECERRERIDFHILYQR